MHKVIEFKASLTDAQTVLLETTTDCLTRCWNRGLALLEWREYYDLYIQAFEVEDTWGFDVQVVDIKLVPIAQKSKKQKWVQCCPVSCNIDKNNREDDRSGVLYRAKSHWNQSPPFGPGTESVMVWGAFAQKRWDGKPAEVPQVYVNEFLSKVLYDSWKAYKGGIRKRPRYRNRNRSSDQVTTIILRRSGDNIKVDRRHDLISIPGFGGIRCLGLCDRLPKDAEVRKVAIVRRASGVYLQLTVSMDGETLMPDSDKSVGLDLGLQYLYATSEGHEVSPQREYRAMERKLARLQRRLAAKKGRKFPMQPGSNRYKKAQRELALLHEKIAMMRRNFNHWHSTKLVRQYGAIAVEDIQWNQMNRRAKPKLSEDGKTFERNNQAQKSGLNKSFADAAIGQFRSMIEEKCAVGNREFVKVSPHYTSQECPGCGTIQKKALSQRTHECSECGYVAGRDVAAAQNILARADFVRSYRGVHREVKGGESPSETVKRQSESATIGTLMVSENKPCAEGEGNSPSVNPSQGEQASPQAKAKPKGEKPKIQVPQGIIAPRKRKRVHAIAANPDQLSLFDFG